jgi:alkyldihydroxyacetonephosphate synthase
MGNSELLIEPSQDIKDIALPPALAKKLQGVIGQEKLLFSKPDRYAYSRDRLPYGLYRIRVGALPGTLPSVIVLPASTDDLVKITQFCLANKVALIPYGAGSGVLGGTIPLHGEIIVDLKKMNRIIDINETNCTVTVQAGMNGMQFEEALNQKGYTAGHYPQSISMSTVGGWAACRGAGQASSRFGKIEDMVLGLKAVLPNGELLEVRPVARRSVGPSIKDIFVGSEGVLGFITELTLRIWKKSVHSEGCVLAFPSIQSGFDALKEIMQSELRPEVIRLYDEEESGQRTENMPEFKERPILCVMKFSGLKDLLEVEKKLSLEIAYKHGASAAGLGPYQHWEKTRYQSYSTQWQTDNYYMDTIEVTSDWSNVMEMYQTISKEVKAIYPETYFGAHWSHIYSEGLCQYMTIRLPPMENIQAHQLHLQLWDKIESICLSFGGSLAHHHGVGLLRGRWLKEELNQGMQILGALKKSLDPSNLFNPGKLGLPLADGAIDLEFNKK